MYLLPQEIEVWYIIPAIRKELARVLTRKYGFSFGRAGDALGVSKAAVSQYLANKRANKIKLNDDVKREVAKSAKVISEKPKAALAEMQRLLRVMKDKKCSCDVCKKFNRDVLKFCGHDGPVC